MRFKIHFRVKDHAYYTYWSEDAMSAENPFPTLLIEDPKKAGIFNNQDHNWLWHLCQDTDSTHLEADVLPMDQQMTHNGAKKLL